MYLILYFIDKNLYNQNAAGGGKHSASEASAFVQLVLGLRVQPKIIGEKHMQVAEIGWQVQGDIGGIGISRFWFVRQSAGNITVADANAAAAASHGVISAAGAFAPQAINWTCQSQVNVYDSASGLVQGPIVISSLPAMVAGAETGPYGGGLGARVNWKTATVTGRRLLRGALFLVPLGNEAFTSQGAVQAAVLTLVNPSLGTYLAAMNAASLNAVIWSRPKKGTFAGGTTGPITGGAVSITPAGLRSRRS